MGAIQCPGCGKLFECERVNDATVRFPKHPGKTIAAECSHSQKLYLCVVHYR